MTVQEAPEAPAADEPRKAPRLTSYVVLEDSQYRADWDPPDTAVSGPWRHIGRVDAHNDVDAIRRATADLDAEDRSGTFVAVPVRSWRPRTRSVKVVEKEQWA